MGDDGDGMDCSVQPTQIPGLSLVQTVDFFYPSVHDPYWQGKIGAANVLSDLYAMGVVNCDNVLMILGVSTQMTDEESDVTTPLMMKGFTEHVHEVCSKVRGGQSVRNPWPMIGGIATAVVFDKDIIRPENAEAGDVLVLTKALGTQVAVNLYQWMCRKCPEWDAVRQVVTESQALEAYYDAADSMMRLNRTGAELMHKYHAHACTDVTGFGILGHASNLARNQKNGVTFRIHSLPIIRNIAKVNDIISYGLLQGYSAETSGGLLIAMSKEDAALFCAEIEERDGVPAHIIGEVLECSAADGRIRQAFIEENATVIEV